MNKKESYDVRVRADYLKFRTCAIYGLQMQGNCKVKQNERADTTNSCISQKDEWRLTDGIMPRYMIASSQLARRQHPDFLSVGIVVALGRHQLSADRASDVPDESELIRIADRVQIGWIVHGALDVVAERSLGAVTPE